MVDQDTTFATERARTEALLSGRPSRPADGARDSEVERRLSGVLAERRGYILSALAKEALYLCDAGSAGVSFRRPDGDGFFWPAIAGAWARFEGSGPRMSASPCAIVLQENATLVFPEPASRFPDAQEVEPAIVEIMLAPIRQDGAPVGTIWVLSHQPDRRFDSEDRRRLEALAAFASANRVAPTPKPFGMAEPATAFLAATDTPESARLEALYSYGVLDTAPEAEFDGIARLASRICEARVAIISLVDADRQWFKARVGLDGRGTAREGAICALAIDTPAAVTVIPDLTADPRTRDNPLVIDGPTLRFYAGAALRSPEGLGLGALCVFDSKARPDGLSAEQVNSLELLAQQTMALLEMRRAAYRRAGEAADHRRPTDDLAERLRATEARMRSAQSVARIGVFEIAADGDEVFGTPEFAEVFGVDVRDSYSAELISSLVVPQDRHIAGSRISLARGTASTDVEFRIHRQSDGAMRWVHRRAAFERDAEGRAVRLIGIVEDVTDRKLAEARAQALVNLGDALRDAETAQEAASAGARLVGETIGAARAGYARVDVTAELFLVQGGWSATPGDEIGGRFPFSLFPRSTERLLLGLPVVAYRLPADWPPIERESYRQMGAEAMINLPIFGKGTIEGVLFVQAPSYRAWAPEEIAFARAVADRVQAAVAKIQAEADQRLLNLELSHRMKNTMAVVQSIAQMTLRQSADPEHLQAFDERLTALARAHEVLLGQNWVTARIRGVAESAFAAHGLERVSLSGPELNLNARSALNLAMLLHELATNAAKYGALVNADGRVDVAWRVVGAGRPAMLELTWQESGGPRVHPPERRGFGSRLLKAGFGGDGQSDIAYAPEGLRAAFNVPLAQVLEE